MQINDGGPAYPRPAGDYNGTRHGNGAQVGISMRDYFAAKAMQGYFAAPHTLHRVDADNVAQYCYEMADAMIRARSQGETNGE